MIQRLEGWLAGRPTVLKIRNPWALAEVRASHPRTPISDLQNIFHQKPELRTAIAENISKRLGHDFETIDFNLFEDQKSPFQFMRLCIRYANADEPRVRVALIKIASSNSRVSLEAFIKLEKDGIKPEEVRMLANSLNPRVQRIVVTNQNTPLNIIAEVLSRFDAEDEEVVRACLEILLAHPQSKRNEILSLMKNNALSGRLDELL